MPALLSVLSWLVCLFGFLSAVHADHPANDQKPETDHHKKIEIRVQVNGDDVQIEAMEDGKKVDLEESGQQHAHENKQVKVFVNRSNEDDQNAKKIMILKMGKDGDGPNMSWHTGDHDQLMVSPEGAANMVFMSSPQAGKFKLGVGLAPIGNLIRAQLHIADETGIAVETVMDESPAAKAGLQRYDIIVKVNDSDVRELSGLIKAIEEAGESKSAVRLAIVRGGAQQTISVMPESNEAQAELKREAEWTEKPSNEPVDADALQDLRKQLQELRTAVEQLRKAVNE